MLAFECKTFANSYILRLDKNKMLKKYLRVEVQQ